MKTAHERIGHALPEIRIKIPIRRLVIRAIQLARLARYWALRAPQLERAQGPGLPTLPEHEWRAQRTPRVIA
ncbi:MAG: hypothetical protein ACXVB9_17830 [Bdellovibrionota bacterium]